MALNVEQLKFLAALYDRWFVANADVRSAITREAEAQGSEFVRAFDAMVKRASALVTEATWSPIPEAMRDAAIAASRTDADTSRAAASLDQAPPPRAPGQHVGPYRLIKEIGRGGMGVVWLAARADGQHERQVALKMPLLENLNWLLAARFARERNILASLEHPGIARLYDAGVDSETQPYIALEYVVGVPINDYVRDRALTPEATAQLFTKVIHAVSHAHAQLVIHRDIKPTNILVDGKGDPHLLDFGIAKLLDDEDSMSAESTQLTRLSGRALTLDYASPEQVNGQTLGTASDVYALGVVLYELLTGNKPYTPKGPTRRDLELAICEQEPTKPSDRLMLTGTSEAGKTARRVRGDLDTVVLKALKKDPRQRYATALAFADDLKRYLAFEPITAKPDSEWYRITKFVRRNRVAMVGVTMLLLTGAAGVISTLWHADRATQEAARANVEAAQKVAASKRATAVSEFLSEIFLKNTLYQKDPKQAQSITAMTLLESGIARAESSLKDEPETLYEVLKLLQELTINLGRRNDELRIAKKLFELAKSRETQRASDVVKSGVNLANAQFIESTHADAERTLAEVATYLDRARAEGWTGESSYYFVKAMVISPRDFEQAVALYEAAERLERPKVAQLTMSDRNWRNYVASATTLASALAWVGRSAEADEVLLRVETHVNKGGAEAWLFQARVASMRGHVQSITGRPAEGVASIERALEAYRAHGQGEHWQALRTRALMLEPLSLLGRWQDARDAAATVLEHPVLDKADSDVFNQWSMMQAVLMRDRGEITHACRSMRAALPTADKPTHRVAVLNEFGPIIVATCAQSRTTSDHRFARALFDAELTLSMAKARLGKKRGRDHYLNAGAALEIASGRFSAARSQLTDEFQDERFDDRVLIADRLPLLLRWCEASDTVNDARTCEALTERALSAAAAQSDFPKLPPLYAAIRYARADALARIGRRDEARAEARRALAMSEVSESPLSENTARLRVLLKRLS